MAAVKITLMKMHVNINVVLGQNFQHENLSYESFITQKFPNLYV